MGAPGRGLHGELISKSSDLPDGKISRSPKAQRKAEAKERKRKNRPKISRGKRARVYRRDGHKCVRCGEDDLKKLTLDHITPVSRGGGDGDENLQTMCRRCNILKGSKTGGNGMKWPSEREMRRAGLIS